MEELDLQFKSTVRGNQTAAHEELANRAMLWLASRSTFSGCMGATEFEIAEGYSADAFVLCRQEHRFHLELMRAIGFTKTERVHKTDDFPGWDSETCEIPQDVMSHVFEVKVSRSDWLRTFGKEDGDHANRWSPVANLHYCVTPKGMIDPVDLPRFWGLLEASGRGLRLTKPPIYQATDPRVNDRFGHRLLWRPDSEGRRRHLQIRQCPECLKEIPEVQDEA